MTAHADVYAQLVSMRYGSGVTGGGAGDLCVAMHRNYNHQGEFDACKNTFCMARRAWLAEAAAVIDRAAPGKWTARQRWVFVWLLFKEAVTHPVGISEFWPQADGKSVKVIRRRT